nr:aminodeoxychorismate synthase, chloroplastic [Ipomoea batatas]
MLKTKLDAANPAIAVCPRRRRRRRLPTPKRRSSSRRSFKSLSPSPTLALPDGEAPGRRRSRLRRQESLPSPSFPPLPSHQSLRSRLSSGLCYSEVAHNGSQLFHEIPSGRNSGFKVG